MTLWQRLNDRGFLKALRDVAGADKLTIRHYDPHVWIAGTWGTVTGKATLMPSRYGSGVLVKLDDPYARMWRALQEAAKLTPEEEDGIVLDDEDRPLPAIPSVAHRETSEEFRERQWKAHEEAAEARRRAKAYAELKTQAFDWEDWDRKSIDTAMAAECVPTLLPETFEQGSVEVRLAGETRRVPALKTEDAITAFGFVGRLDGGRDWLAAVIYEDGQTEVYFGVRRETETPWFLGWPS